MIRIDEESLWVVHEGSDTERMNVHRSARVRAPAFLDWRLTRKNTVISYIRLQSAGHLLFCLSISLAIILGSGNNIYAADADHGKGFFYRPTRASMGNDIVMRSCVA